MGALSYFSCKAERTSKGSILGSLESKDQKRLLSGNSSGAYASPGYLLFVKERSLMAQRLDVKNLELAGEPFPIAEPVGFYNTVTATFSVSDTGVLAHASGSAAERQLAWFDRAGKLVERIGPPMLVL